MIPSSISAETAQRMADMDQTLLLHRVMTQAHRWFQAYEQSNYAFKNQLDILAPDVHMKTSLGEGRGVDTYAQRFANIPANWRNAHHVQTANASRLADGSLALLMDIVYQNVGIVPGGGLIANRLHYSTRLADSATVLPIFTDIATELIAPETDPAFATFTDAYAQNRLKSLAHYWLTLIETNSGDATPFQEIFADEIDIDFPSQHCPTFVAFAQWFQNTAAQVAKSSHTIERFELEAQAGHQYKLTMEFEWAGFACSTPNQELEARTLHEWVVVDTPQERFARVQSVKVTALKPLQPCSR